MKIRIIKDMSAENNSTVLITKFIGKVFDGKLFKTGSVEVDFGEDLGLSHVFEGEYEVVEDNINE